MADMIDTLINGKWNIKLPKHRAERPEWYAPEGWEKKRLEKMHDIITNYIRVFTHDKPVMYYVGAEEGDMAALCQMWGAKMVLFEPNKKVWPNTKAIWEANQLENPHTFAGFASNKTTDSAWRHLRSGFLKSADGEIIGDHGFKELHEPSDESGDIPQIKIDDVFTTVPEMRPDIISLDVEGSEWEVLKGAEETLKKYGSDIFLSAHPEFMFRIYGQYLNDLRAWITALGYKEELIDYQHEVHLYYTIQ